MSPSSTQRRRLAAERRLAQLGRAPRHAERGVDGRLVGRVRQRLERRDVGGRARRAHAARCRTRSGRGGDELDRHALDGHAERPPLAPLDHRDDLRQRREALQQRAGSRPAQTTASRSHESRQRRGSPAGSPPSAAAIAADELAGARQREPARRPRLGLARERLEQLRLGLRPDARAPRAAGRRPPPRGTPPACGRRAPARSRPSAAPSARGSGRARSARARARARARPARRSRPSRPARAAAPRCPGRSRAAPRTRPAAHELRRPAAPTPRISSAARR